MPCPLITEGFRQELLAISACRHRKRSSRIVVRYTLFARPEGGIPHGNRCWTLTLTSSLLIAPVCTRPSRRLNLFNRSSIPVKGLFVKLCVFCGVHAIFLHGGSPEGGKKG